MISNNDTNRIRLFTHPTCASFSCLDLSCSLPPPPPSPYPYASIYIQLPHTDTPFFRLYRKAWANKKVFSCDLNWNSNGTFLKEAGREFQRDGAMKLKERCPNNLRFRFEIFSNFSLEHRLATIPFAKTTTITFFCLASAVPHPDSWWLRHVVPDVVMVDTAGQALDIFLHGPESAHKNGILKTFTYTSIPILPCTLLKQTKSKTLNSPNMKPSLSCPLHVQCVGGWRPGSLADAPQDCSMSVAFLPRTELTENICRCVQQILQHRPATMTFLTTSPIPLSCLAAAVPQADSWWLGHMVPDDVIIAHIGGQALDIFFHDPESVHNNGIVKTFTHTSIPIHPCTLLKQRAKSSTHKTWCLHLVVLFLSNVVVATARKLGRCTSGVLHVGGLLS